VSQRRDSKTAPGTSWKVPQNPVAMRGLTRDRPFQSAAIAPPAGNGGVFGRSRARRRQLVSPVGQPFAVSDGDIRIHELVEDDVDAVVEFSLRRGNRSSLRSARFWANRSSSVYTPTGRPVGSRLSDGLYERRARHLRRRAGRSPGRLVAVAFDAFHERMAVIEIIGVDPDYRRRGIGTRLTEFAVDHRPDKTSS
jgi:GNAT superfamily N-acetyltransferase